MFGSKKLKVKGLLLKGLNVVLVDGKNGGLEEVSVEPSEVNVEDSRKVVGL
jgi:hypothetical protein